MKRKKQREKNIKNDQQGGVKREIKREKGSS